MTPQQISTFIEVIGWLEGCLECKEWNWSPDQWSIAKEATEEARKIIKEYENDTTE